MIRASRRTCGLLAAVILLAAVPASAQVVQSVHIGVGGFFPRGFDSRAAGDVLTRNYWGEPLPADPTVTDALVFDISDFRSGHVSGEWNIAFGQRIEFGAGVGLYGQTVPTIYLDVVDENGFNIEQRLRLKVVPVTGLVRFLPFGRAGDVQPYVGVGISALRYRYSETGEFVDPSTLDIFADEYVATGTALGGVVLGGLRLPLGGDIYALTFEYRYQFGVGDTGGPSAGFVADKIDLGGGAFDVGLLIRF